MGSSPFVFLNDMFFTFFFFFLISMFVFVILKGESINLKFLYFCFRTCVCVCDFERENKKSKLLCLGFWWLLWSNWRTWSWGFCFWVSDLGWWTWYWGFCFWVSDPNWWTWSWPLGVYFLGFWSRSVCGGLGLQENFFFFFFFVWATDWPLKWHGLGGTCGAGLDMKKLGPNLAHFHS